MENNNNESTTPQPRVLYTQDHVAQLHTTIADLEKQVKELTLQSNFRLEDMQRFKQRYENERNNRLKVLNLARDLFEEMLENDEDTLENYEDKYNSFVELGMEGFSKQVEFVISYIVTVSGTANVPYGSDFSEYDSSFIDITVDEDHFSGELLDECTEITMEVEVEERDRSRSWEVTQG